MVECFFSINKGVGGLLSLGLALMLGACVFALGRCDRRAIGASFVVEASHPFDCQIFYSDNPSSPHRNVVTFSVQEGRRNIRTSLCINRLKKFRIDFGAYPGRVKVGPIHLSGKLDHVLKWHDFHAANDLDRFVVSDDGSAEIVSNKGDPYVVYKNPLDVEGKLLYSWHPVFPMICLLIFGFALWWLLVGPHGICWDGWVEKGMSICSRNFVLLVLIAAFARLTLTARLPPFFRISAWDDIWFVNTASALCRGDWLGAYDQHTLIKGCFGPMVLAFARLVGMSFLTLTALLHILGGLFSLFLLSRLVRNRLVLFAILVFLFFNPVSFDYLTWQRIYRNGMAVWQVPLVIGSLFLLVFNCKNSCRRMFKWAIVSGLSLWMFFNTREDGMWAWPFILVCVVFASVGTISVATTLQAKFARGVVVTLPLFIVVAGNLILCAINKMHYGMALRNDRDAGNYAKAMRDIYLIKPDPKDEARLSSPDHARHYHNIYYSTLQKAYAASPTLSSAKMKINLCVKNWAKAANYCGLDLHYDHMLFAIRDGAYQAGFYKSLADSEKFFGDVHRELTRAFAIGRIERKGFSFTAMAAPFRMEFAPRVLQEWWNAIVYVAMFKDIAPRLDMRYSRSPVCKSYSPMTGDWLPDSDGSPSVQLYVDRAAMVSTVYSVVSPYAFVLALTFHFVIFVMLVCRKECVVDLWVWWLLATGLFVSFLLHTACIGYMSATTFWATMSSYLCPSYQLVLMFVVVVAGMVAKVVQNQRRGVARGE